LTVLQPDAAKWGGITGCLAVAPDVLASKRHYCPHFLGGVLPETPGLGVEPDVAAIDKCRTL
jgi:L-alanine-DL-glutamate epimerase-like enolase superfamily enzyme